MVPARVHALTPGTSRAAVGDRVHDLALGDALQEQTCASSGSAAASAPPRPVGRISSAGWPAARCRRGTIGRSDAYADGVADQDAAEQRLRVVGEDQLRVDAGDRVGEDDARARPRWCANASPNEATSTPSSLSLVDSVGAGEGAPGRRAAGRPPPRPSRSRARPGRSIRPAGGRALADRADAAGRRCGSARRRATPPRSPSGQAGRAGQLVAGPDAGGEHHERPASSGSASVGWPAPATRRPVADGSRSVTAPVCTVSPSSSTCRRSIAPPASSTCTASAAARTRRRGCPGPSSAARWRPPGRAARRRPPRRSARPRAAPRIASRSSMVR